MSTQEPLPGPDTEFELVLQDLHARVSPYGASLRGVWQVTESGQKHEIITGYSGAKDKVGGQGDVLIPFPGRVRDGRYMFQGQVYQMTQNDKDGPNAIHGFLRQLLWDVTEATESSRTFSTNLDPNINSGYPFSLQATIRYTLTPSESESVGLTCRFSVTNTGNTPAPVAAGFHPYFTVGSSLIDEDSLLLPFSYLLEFENLLPTGKILSVTDTPYDFRTAHPIGTTAFNTCFCDPIRDPDGLVRIRLTAPDCQRTVTVWFGTPLDYVVLYSGDPLPDSHRRRSLAIEPMTCASDGFNHPTWGLVALAPGDTFSGTWGVQAH
jgi:aldose 1-epimerase